MLKCFYFHPLGGAGADHQEERVGTQAVLCLHQGLLGQVSVHVERVGTQVVLCLHQGLLGQVSVHVNFYSMYLPKPEFCTRQFAVYTKYRGKGTINVKYVYNSS